MTQLTSLIDLFILKFEFVANRLDRSGRFMGKSDGNNWRFATTINQVNNFS